jgi:hypothetical protein
MKFGVEVTLYSWVTVEAPSAEEAAVMANELPVETLAETVYESKATVMSEEPASLEQSGC